MLVNPKYLFIEGNEYRYVQGIINNQITQIT